MQDLPKKIEGGHYPQGHVQGIAVDTKQGFVYYSFTTSLVKTDLQGNLIGSVEGLTGHLGCIDISPEDGRIYGSLEYKNDSIGQGIFKRLGRDGAPLENAFYIAVFEADRITRPNMDAERDAIMNAVYLPDVVRDFEAEGLDGHPHRYACSGCDGLAFAPAFGADADAPCMLMLAYGIYGNTERTDNDHQVILQYDPRVFDAYAKPLRQEAPHHDGPSADARYFAYTGNTNWGVQNLCYDAEARRMLLFVYRGKKAHFPNYGLYAVDCTKPPKIAPLMGLNGEEGPLLPAAEIGILHEESGVRGFEMDLGQCGIHALGNSLFYIAKPYSVTEGQKHHGATLLLYRYTGKEPTGFEAVV